MLPFVLRRLLSVVPLLLLVSLFTFVLLQYMGDPLLPMRQYARLAKTLRQFGQGQGGSS